MGWIIGTGVVVFLVLAAIDLTLLTLWVRVHSNHSDDGV